MQLITPNLGFARFQSHGLGDIHRHQFATPLTATDALSATAPVSATQPGFDSDAVFKAVLSFVQHRLTQAAQQGASKEELASLLAQAREGATNGIDQAIAVLKDNGSFNDALGSGIADAKLKIEKGFDDLAKQLGLTTAGDTTTPTTTPAPPASTLNELAATYRERFSSKQSVDLLVTTADGDTVQLQLRVRDKQSLDASYQSGADGQQLAVSFSEKSSARLNIQINGNLDADELQALNDLLDTIGDLADSFFGGDTSSAQQQASGLELGSPELSSLSLNLHSQVRREVALYQQVQSLGGDAPAPTTALSTTPTAPTTTTSTAPAATPSTVPSTTPSTAPATTPSTAPASTGLFDLATALSSLLPKLSLTENAAGLLKQLLAAQLGASDAQTNPLIDFANRLLDALGADTATDTASTSASTS